MSYDLHANNTDLSSLHLALGTWEHLLEQCGSYFTCIHHGGKYFMVFDERMTTHYHDINGDGVRETVVDKECPAILCNCGFKITEEEARVMARIAKNYVAIQRALETLPPKELPAYPREMSTYMIDLHERFAEWAEKSQGFEVF